MAVCFCAVSGAQTPGPAASAQAARTYLLSTLPEHGGPCKGEFPAANVRHGGKTALCCYALLRSGLDPQKGDRLDRAIRWVAAAEMKGTYAVAMRICALTAADAKAYRKQIARDVAWLARAADAQGRYTYGPQPDPPVRYDNSNTQMAVLAAARAAEAGQQMPATWWRRIEQHFQAQQQADGGWGYWIPPGRVRTRSYGSMTAAGFSSLYLAWLQLHEEQFVACRPTERAGAIDRGLAWLDKHFDPRTNPGKVLEWYYYWLWSVQRVAAVTGRKRFGGTDWFAAAADRLGDLQRRDGRFGYDDGVAETALALLFLSHGRRPVGLSKLQWPGRWNGRPRDAAGIVRYLDEAFENPVRWQVISAEADWDDFNDAPLLYISGAGPIQLTDKHLARLRRFVQAGGMILSEAAGNNGDFTVDIQRLYQRMGPEMTFRRVGPDDPLLKAQYRLDDPGLFGLHNGVRWVALHSPREISLALHRYDRQDAEERFRLLANCYLYAAGFGPPAPLDLPEPAPFTAARPPAATVKIARIRHGGNWDPEPAAWSRLARLLAAVDRVRLDVQAVRIDKLDAREHPIGVMTGTGRLNLSEQQLAALRAWLAAGATLLIDAAGGDQTFADDVRKTLLALPAGGRSYRVQPGHAVYRAGPARIDEVTYRRAIGQGLGADRKGPPRLLAVRAGGRDVIYFSPDDWTAGLVGSPSLAVRGYSIDDARRLVRSVLYHLADPDGSP